MWQRVREIFEAALEQPEESREQFVQRECAGDEPLLHEVISLLEADKVVGPLHRELPLADLATMIGALTLARALGPTPFSDELLAAAKAAIR